MAQFTRVKITGIGWIKLLFKLTCRKGSSHRCYNDKMVAQCEIEEKLMGQVQSIHNTSDQSLIVIIGKHS